jgi:hypothetical protein
MLLGLVLSKKKVEKERRRFPFALLCKLISSAEVKKTTQSALFI